MGPKCDAGRPVAVIGAGAWGTALAWLIGGRGHEVRLWARRPEHAAEMAAARENAQRLPGTLLPDAVTPTADGRAALADAGMVVTVVPSEHLREVLRQLAPHIPPDACIVSATKGLELDTGKRMSQVLMEETGFPAAQVLALSGPNLSGEIVQGMPATAVVAGIDQQTVASCQAFLSTRLFRIYTNCDILGVEICGALKNVIALAAGICDGLGFGANVRAALITRGLTEMGRIGTRMGAQRATFWGVAGVGDLIATCHSPLSRNFQVGQRLGRGQSLQQALDELQSVAEGVPTTSAVRQLAGMLGVDAPITAALHEVLFGGVSPMQALDGLMTRQWRSETEDWQ